MPAQLLLGLPAAVGGARGADGEHAAGPGRAGRGGGLTKKQKGGFYSCNLYTEGGAEASSSAAGAAGRGPEGQLNWLTQKRFLFYLRKFNSHDVASDDLDPALRRLLGLGRGFLDKPEADAFGRALVGARDTVVFARKTLKYSYVHSYFHASKA